MQLAAAVIQTCRLERLQVPREICPLPSYTSLKEALEKWIQIKIIVVIVFVLLLYPVRCPTSLSCSCDKVTKF
jgi:hypothetical protein